MTNETKTESLGTAKILVDAMTSSDARAFAVHALGVPPARIECVVDEGPVARPERRKPGCRSWAVYLRPTGTNAPPVQLDDYYMGLTP